MRYFNYVEFFVMLATVIQWLVLASITGVVVGTGTTLFLQALIFLTEQGANSPLWLQMLLLPMGGLINGLMLHYGYMVNTCGLKDSLFAAVHVQQGHMPFKTVLIKPIAALITLGSGGSAGKEGPCSHIGASLAAAVGEVLHLNTELRQRLVACGVSAGFAGVFGAPIAGAIYGVEVLSIGRIRHDFLFPAVVAGVTSVRVSEWWGLPYTFYHMAPLPEFSEVVFAKTLLIGIIAGVVALLFVEAVKGSTLAFDKLRRRFDLWPPLMPFIGGLLMAALILVIPRDYLGLSLPLVKDALAGQVMPFIGVIWKILLVAITLGSGFYGGVATPQFVIGAIAGSACAHLFGLDPALGAAVGLVSVVGAASNTPIAAILLGMELFGGNISLVYVTGAAIAAYVIIGHRSIYPDQRMAYSKSNWVRVRPDLQVGIEKARLSHGLLRWLKMHRRKRNIYPRKKK